VLPADVNMDRISPALFTNGALSVMNQRFVTVFSMTHISVLLVRVPVLVVVLLSFVLMLTFVLSVVLARASVFSSS